MDLATRRLLRAASIESQSLRHVGVAAPPAGRVHLHGAVIAAGALRSPATVVIDGGRIAEILDGRVAAGPDGRDVDVDGVIAPGFVDVHNHVAYGVFPRWRPARLFHSRFGWRGRTRCDVVMEPDPDPHYRQRIADPHVELRRDPAMLAAMACYSLVRGVLGGTTAVLVDDELVELAAAAGLVGFVRDPDDWTGRVLSLLDVGCVIGDALDEVQRRLGADPRARLLVHVAEGLDPLSRGELHTLDRKRLLGASTGLIHAIAALDADWQRVRDAGATLVWAPASNLHFYGATVDIDAVLARGVPALIAPDWPVSGSSTMLDELRLAAARGVDPVRLLEMATVRPADWVGASRLGRLEPGANADLLVVDVPAASLATAARAIVTADVSKISLVVVGGRAVCGTPAAVAGYGDADGLVAEHVTIAGPSGPIDRVLRLGPAPVFAPSRDRVAAAFASRGMEMAPLWEAN